MHVHLKNLFLVDIVTLLYKYKVIWNGNYTGIYTNIWIAWEELSDAIITFIELFIWIRC